MVGLHEVHALIPGTVGLGLEGKWWQDMAVKLPVEV